MSSIKLDIAKSGVVITEQMKAQAQQANDCSIRARVRAAIFWDGYTSPRR